MKRTGFVLAALLLVLPLCACAEAFGLMPTPSPTLRMITVAIPEKTPVPEGYIPVPEPTEAPYESYDRCLDYALETFGFDDSLAYPYLPTHIDPVCFNSYLSLTAGRKADDSYAAYSLYTEEDVQDYLDFLRWWGYQVKETECHWDGFREWRADCPSPCGDGMGLMEQVRICYSPEWQMLAIINPYLDGFLYKAWSESTFDPFGYSRQAGNTPWTMELEGGCSVTIEELRYPSVLDVLTEGELCTQPYGEKRLEDVLITRHPSGDAAKTCWRLETLASRPGQMRCFLAVHLSFDEPVSAAFLQTLRVAAADTDAQGSHFADVPMLCAVEENGGFSIWADGAETSDLWLIFPPRFYKAYEPRRIYLHLKDPDHAWIGDLRQWTHVDLYPAYQPEGMDTRWTLW